MNSLSLKEHDLILLGAIFARNLYDLRFNSSEYCEQYGIDIWRISRREREMIEHPVPHLKDLSSGYFDRKYELTAEGVSYLLLEVDAARTAFEKINDLIALMALDRPLIQAAGQLRASEDEEIIEGDQRALFIERFSDEHQRGVFSRLLRKALVELDTQERNNAEIAQAKAYIESAILLSECPEPQGDLVWELCQRGSNIAGIGSLILAIIAFILVG